MMKFLSIYYEIILEKFKLIFVMLHFRHGARAPTSMGETKIDKIGEYSENEGALTGVGERMHYLLGLRNRLRYIKDY